MDSNGSGTLITYYRNGRLGNVRHFARPRGAGEGAIVTPLVRTRAGYIEAANELRTIAAMYREGGTNEHVKMANGWNPKRNEMRLRYHAKLLESEFRAKAKAVQP